MSWTVPRLWPNRTVVVLASGPSMRAEVAESVRGLPAIAINRTFEHAPWADMLYAADANFWRVTEGALAFAGLKVSCYPQEGGIPPSSVKLLRNSGTSGFDECPAHVRTGYNSGYQAIHIAVHAGAKRILLLGYDMKGGHWHPPHEKPLKNPTVAAFFSWKREFATLARILKEKEVEVLNCTPDSALKCFPMMALERALEESDDTFSRRLA